MDSSDLYGQCGVSSAWLAEALHHEYSIPSIFCRGSLIFSDQQAESVLDHCWLEINCSAGVELILDLTCDQAQGFDRPIVFHAKTDLDRQGVRYIPHDRLSISDLPGSPVWPRYQSLLGNLRQLGWISARLNFIHAVVEPSRKHSDVVAIERGNETGINARMISCVVWTHACSKSLSC